MAGAGGCSDRGRGCPSLGPECLPQPEHPWASTGTRRPASSTRPANTSCCGSCPWKTRTSSKVGCLRPAQGSGCRGLPLRGPPRGLGLRPGWLPVRLLFCCGPSLSHPGGGASTWDPIGPHRAAPAAVQEDCLQPHSWALGVGELCLSGHSPHPAARWTVREEYLSKLDLVCLWTCPWPSIPTRGIPSH